MSADHVPPPDNDAVPEWVDDSKAKQEIQNWPDDEKLQGQRNKNNLMWLCVYGVIVAIMMVVVSAVVSVGVLSWAWHYLTPSDWAWLSPDQLSKIQSVIFSGALGSVLTRIVLKEISK